MRIYRISTNVGAKSIGEYGDYFAWGETSAKQLYHTSTYKFGDGAVEFTKYNKTDNLTLLESSDDAATVLWGDKWRTPTKAEWEELVNNTECEFTTINDVFGCKLTSIVTGYTNKSLFFPASDHKGASNTLTYTSGSYWSSTAVQSSPKNVYVLIFSKNQYSTYNPTVDTDLRQEGRTVRPVRKLN